MEKINWGKRIHVVNWFKVAGIALMVLGVLLIISGTIVGMSFVGGETVVHQVPLWVPALGIVMLVAGLYLYYLGRKKMKGV